MALERERERRREEGGRAPAGSDDDLRQGGATETHKGCKKELLLVNCETPCYRETLRTSGKVVNQNKPYIKYLSTLQMH